MDFQLMQWRNQQQQYQSEHQQKQQVGVDRKQDQQQQQEHHNQQQSLSALPLFLAEPVSKVGNNLSVLPDTSKFPSKSKNPYLQLQKTMMMMGGQFSTAQWQELELQAVIFRYMLAGASVPAELLQPIKNSLLNTCSFFLHHPIQHFPLCQPPTVSLQSGYWGRAGMDPEPGRCRRTDGKKWRCSRDVAPGYKYCERHMNRGRNRSRKPVESRRPGGPDFCETARMASPLGSGSRAHAQFTSVGGTEVDMRHLNNSSSDGRVLRPFFDDWSTTAAESGCGGINADLVASSTSLSMSIQGSSTISDVSLKLSTGAGNEEASAERDQTQLNWMAHWGQHQAGPMGGPLAEAFRWSAAQD